MSKIKRLKFEISDLELLTSPHRSVESLLRSRGLKFKEITDDSHKVAPSKFIPLGKITRCYDCCNQITTFIQEL